MNTILASVLSLSVLGLGLGLGLAYASKKFHIERDPRVEEVQKVLVGINCGACGFPGCSGAAEAIVKGEAPVDVCLPGAEEVAAKVGRIMGVSITASAVKRHAVVLCQGNDSIVKKRFAYNGLHSCAAAARLMGGDKACAYGCLGYADCVRVCTFNAIMVQNGIAVIDREKCTACQLCVRTCPKKIIRMVPAKEKRLVFCHSHDTGKVSRSRCAVSCIACGICVKSCPFEAITIENNLATIDPVKCTNCGICEEKCPTKAITAG